MTKRTTISLSDDLKARMDATEGHVNWSAVAAQAFEAKLAEIAKQRKDYDMDAVVQRLRASRIEGENEEFQAGREDGERWAKEHAEWIELDNLNEALRDSSFWDEEPGHLGWPGAVVRATNPRKFHEEGWGWRENEEFWEFVGNPSPSFDWLRGFCEGATDIFTEASKHL